MSNPIKLGMVGVGRAGYNMHLREFKGKEDMIQIVAVCDIEADRREKMQAEYGCKVYEKIEDLVMDPEVEVVDIATRSCDHFKHAKTALDAGKLVMLEKPMCTSYKEAKFLMDLADKDGKRRLFVRHNRRFEAKFMQVNEIIESGILGEVFMIKLARGGYERRKDWQTLSQYGGGQLLNWGPHIIDHSLRFCGGEYKNLTAHTRQIAAAGDCEDYIHAVFEGINGRIVQMEISGGTALTKRQPEYEIYGSKGTLVDNGTTYTLHYIDPACELKELVADIATPGAKAGFGGVDAPEWITEEKEWNTNALDHVWPALYEAVRNGVDYPIKSAEALKVMETISEIKAQNKFF